MSRTRIKICGVTNTRDAQLAVELGADYLGLNFYEPSPRYVSVDQAQLIAAAVAGAVSLVGVFVNAMPTTVETIAAEVGLDLLQFHGDEGLTDLAPFAERAIKVLRLDMPPEPDLLDRWPGMWGYLVEGRHADLYGGSGDGWAYEMIGNLSRQRPFFVAGGLAPENVRDAMKRSRAWGVDVCSGVEAAPGIKDSKLMQEFFDEVRRGDE